MRQRISKKPKITIDFSEWINRKYAEWIVQQQPSRNSKKYFADYLGISQSMLSGFFYGKRLPSKTTIYNLSQVLGKSIYKELGVQEPPEDLSLLMRKWRQLSEEKKEQIIRIALD